MQLLKLRLSQTHSKSWSCVNFIGFNMKRQIKEKIQTCKVTAGLFNHHADTDTWLIFTGFCIFHTTIFPFLLGVYMLIWVTVHPI